VTLTGAGGSGKTALALTVAESLRSEFPHGVFVSWLAPIRDRELLAAAIAGPLGVQESGGRTAAELLPAYLRTRQILLVLDNFEQLASAAAYLADLLAAAPGLRLIVTCQISLGLRAEQVYDVPPLPVPARGSSPDDIRSNPSVLLFEARVRAVRPSFQVTDDEAGVILEIVERLDGLPLAIELAAARMRMLTPAAVLARLDRRLAILTGGGADRPERHQTLRATLDWSFDLLEADARTLLARLSVFGGGFDLDAVEAVCGHGIDALQTLVEHSLVRAEEIGGEPRFSMLEAIREYAAERLAESGDQAAMRGAHAAAFLEVAETHRRLILGREGARHLDRLERDHDNLRGALRWAIDHGDPEIALRMVASLWRFWQLRGHLDEGRQWTEAALALATTRSDLAALRSAALVAEGGLLYWQADMARSTDRYVEALSLARSANDAGWIVEASEIW
jgi:predicted ATPase